MTLIIDHKSSMPGVVNASSSSDLVRCPEKWLECYMHGLSMVMKHIVNRMTRGDLRVILHDLKVFRDILRIVKQSDINMTLGYAIKQECKNGFETTHEDVEMFVRSVHPLCKVENDNLPVKL